jgi:polygalacturonase
MQQGRIIVIRRDFLQNAIGTVAAAFPVSLAAQDPERQAPNGQQPKPSPGWINVREFGAAGDGSTFDTPAVNRAIESAAAQGGGTVWFPAGTYACYTIRLKSHVGLHLEHGATILAAEVPDAGTSTGGYDPAGPPQPWEAYQDFGHNHWANSLIYGDGLEDLSITGAGLIWGKGLSRGDSDSVPRAESPGVGNKAIALKNCRNATIRDISIKMGGHFAILLTGVDNVVLDGLKIDTNRDGIDIDCCRNVRVSNCSVNSPWDDAICPKSSFALGYARATENVTISDCYVTGAYEFGSMLSGAWKPGTYSQVRKACGRIKCGTESNGGFKNITIANCVFDQCRGLALETVDGGTIEDITVTNLSMRGLVHPPIFLRLGSRMRGPAGAQPGTLRRVLISNVISYDSVAEYPSIISGIPGSPIEDVKISDVYLHQLGGGSPEWAALQPVESERGYPEASMFGTLPATGFFVRHARNLEFSNIEIVTGRPDARPAVWAEDVEGLDCFRLRIQRGSAAFSLRNVREFRNFGSQSSRDVSEALVNRANY